jgi:hypothetical protein
VGAELGALAGVHAPLEEGAEDRGVDGAPVEAGGLVEALELGGGELEDGAGLEKVAPLSDGLPTDVVDAEVAARAHGFEEAADSLGEGLGPGAGLGEEPGDDLLGEEADVLGEEGEDDAVEEAGDLPGVEAALPEGDRELGDAPGGLGGDGLGGRAGLELLRGVEDGAEDLQVPRLAERLERDLVDLLAGGGEVGVNDDPGEVAGDEERRVLEGGAVLVELEVGTSAQPSEPSFLVAPFSKVKRSPVGSTSAGFGWSRLYRGESQGGRAPCRIGHGRRS